MIIDASMQRGDSKPMYEDGEAIKEIHLVSSRIEEIGGWDPDCGEEKTRWGIRMTFSDGQTVCYSDFCDRRETAEAFLRWISDRSLSRSALPDIVHDFLNSWADPRNEAKWTKILEISSCGWYDKQNAK